MTQPKLDLRGRKWKVAKCVDEEMERYEWPHGHVALWSVIDVYVVSSPSPYEESDWLYSEKPMLILDTTDAPRIETAIKKEKEDA